MSKEIMSIVSPRRLQRLASCPGMFFHGTECYIECKPKLRLTTSCGLTSEEVAATSSVDSYNSYSGMDLPEEGSLNGLASSFMEECMDVFLGSVVLPALLLFAICATFIFLPSESRNGVSKSVFAVFAVVVGFGAESLLTTWATHGHLVANLFRMTYS